MRQLLHRLLTDERGFVNLIVPAILAAASFFGRHGGKIGQVAGAAAPVLGGLAAGRAQGRAVEGDQLLGQDAVRARMYDTITQNLLNRYGLESRNTLDRARLGADRAQFELDAPTTRMSQALRGGLLANMPDNTGPQVSGRLTGRVPIFNTPKTIGPEAREAAMKLAQLGRDRLGADTFDVPDLPTAPALPAPPPMSALPKSNWLDTLLSVAGPATSLIGALPGLGAPSADYVRDAVSGIDDRFLRDRPELDFTGDPLRDREPRV